MVGQLVVGQLGVGQLVGWSVLVVSRINLPIDFYIKVFIRVEKWELIDNDSQVKC
jgi:hypothetical protein